MQIFYRTILVIFVSISFLSLGWQLKPAAAAPVIPHPDELARAVQEIESLDAMRTRLASSLEVSSEVPTMQTMQEVCRPVGMQAAALSQENGWQVKQIAAKYRNPDHAPDRLHDVIALAAFNQDPTLIGFWDQETLDDQSGTRYYRRINVEGSCLSCHGLKDNRPQFVKDGYPQDLAYNFKIDDLRGMYAVFIPDSIQAEIRNALD